MARLCILQAGENNPAMERPVPGYADLFRALFAPFPEFELEFIQVRHNEFPENIDDWDAFLVTGSAAGVYDGHDWIEPLKTLIQDIFRSGKPLAGICFGHQIIAEALGGKAVKSEKGWVIGHRTLAGGKANTILDTHDAVKLLYVHQDQVVEAPTGANVFLGDELCPVAAYNIDDRVLTFQGHPEFTPEVVQSIMEFRAENIGADRIEKARSMLFDDHDGAKVAEGIVNFFQRGMRKTQSHVA